MGKTHETASAFDAIVMAAGKGTRMKSELAKVLHPLLGWTLLRHVAEVLRDLGGGRRVFVLGHSREAVENEIKLWKLKDFSWTKAVQEEQRGTGDAVRVGLSGLDPDSDRPIVVLSGDAPLLSAGSVRRIVAAHLESAAAITVGVMRPPSPQGYGRIVENHGQVERIVEEKDASPAEKDINLVNGGFYCFDPKCLRKLLPLLSPNQKTGELYLTDLVGLARAEKLKVGLTELPAQELMGVNDFEQLADAAHELYRRRAREFLRRGVRIQDPRHAYIDMDVEIEPGAVIETQVHLLGQSRVGAEALIEVGARIEDSVIAARARIRAYSYLEGATVGEGAQVGPMARLRPGAALGREVKVGNFVEVKNASLGNGTKVSHLAYVGDAKVGEDSNLGCGFITCNYDGVEKHQTIIGDRVFVGSDVQAVAPVTIGDDAYVASGTTVTHDVPATGDLVIGRVRQENKSGYAKRLKAMKQSAKGRG